MPINNGQIKCDSNYILNHNHHSSIEEVEHCLSSYFLTPFSNKISMQYCYKANLRSTNKNIQMAKLNIALVFDLLYWSLLIAITWEVMQSFSIYWISRNFWSHYITYFPTTCMYKIYRHIYHSILFW